VSSWLSGDHACGTRLRRSDRTTLAPLAALLTRPRITAIGCGALIESSSDVRRVPYLAVLGAVRNSQVDVLLTVRSSGKILMVAARQHGHPLTAWVAPILLH
jgi:hypothetical protein